MKGMVFNYLGEMVEEQFGLEAWDGLLQKTGLDGQFIASETYPDEDLFALVAAANDATGIDVKELLQSFGRFMLPDFKKQNPQFFEGHTDLISFLLTVDRVIHVEVRKLHPDAALPEFGYDEHSNKELTMYYTSPRKLCFLAEGLIDGSAEEFNTKYELTHTECMHDGADKCTLKIKILD